MLYIVASPIGNLSDISSRALETLKLVDYIACEDTRRTAKLLNHYGISKKMVSLHQHTSNYKLAQIADDLDSGLDIAYLSDGGTPNLSDPGAKLNELALAKGVRVVPIPGPSPLLALISVASFACSDFRFIGFFPKKKGRETMAKQMALSKPPIFFFESPNRIMKTISLLREKAPNKKLLVGRELTKVFEQIIVLDLSENNVDNIVNIPEKGEFVLAIFE